MAGDHESARRRCEEAIRLAGEVGDRLNAGSPRTTSVTPSATSTGSTKPDARMRPRSTTYRDLNDLGSADGAARGRRDPGGRGGATMRSPSPSWARRTRCGRRWVRHDRPAARPCLVDQLDPSRWRSGPTPRTPRGGVDRGSTSTRRSTSRSTAARGTDAASVPRAHRPSEHHMSRCRRVQLASVCASVLARPHGS